MQLRSWRVWLAGVALIVLCGRPQPAAAEPVPPPIDGPVTKATASAGYDELLDRALEAFEAQDYARARGLFEHAYALRPNARVLRGLGITALRLKRFSVAKRELNAALVETKQPLTSAQRRGVTQLLTWMQSHLGVVLLRVQPANADVAVDGEPHTEPVLVAAPGVHRIRVSSHGYTTEERAVQITAGTEDAIELTLAPHVAKQAPLLSAVSVATASVSAPEGTAAPLGPAPREPVKDHDESSSVLASPWFWAAVGVVVAGGVVTTVALTSSSSSKDYEKGGLGGVIMLLGRSP